MERLFRILGAFRALVEKNGSSVENTAFSVAHRQIEIFAADYGDGKRHLFARVSLDPGEQDLPEAPPGQNQSIFNGTYFGVVTKALRESRDIVFWIGTVSGAKYLPILRLEGIWTIGEFVYEDDGQGNYVVAGQTHVPTPGTERPASNFVRFGNGTLNKTDSSLRLNFEVPYPRDLDDDGRVDPTRIEAIYDSHDIAATGYHGRRLTNLIIANRNITDGNLVSQNLRTQFLASLAAEIGDLDEESDPKNPLSMHGDRLALSGKGKDHTLEIRPEEGGHSVALSARFKLDGLDLSESLGGRIGKKSVTLSLVRRSWFDIDGVVAALEATEPVPPPSREPQQIVLRLTWDHTVQLSADHSDQDLRDGGLAEAARIFREAAAALPRIARQPQSALPDLAGATTTTFAAFVAGIEVRVDAFAPVLHWPLTRGGPRLAITHHSREDTWPKLLRGWSLLPLSAEPLVATADLATLFDPGPAEPREIKISYHFGTLDESSRVASPGLRYQLFDGGEAIDTSRMPRFRIGSLAFRGNSRLLRDTDISELILTRRDGDPPAPEVGTPTFDILLRLDLSVAQVDPVTVDMAHGDRAARSDDLLIKERATPPDPADAFGLRVTETLSDDRDRRLRADLIDAGLDDDTASEGGSVVVLTRNPFSATRVYPGAIDRSGRAEDRAIASYDSDLGLWQYVRSTDAYTFVRPASGLGEGADKPGRYDIRDAESVPSGDPLLEVFAVPARPTPPTVAYAIPSDLDRNFAPPPNATRTLFTQRGDFGPGMELAGLRTELVYGLSTGLRPPPAHPRRLPARIAEIEALTGRLLEHDAAGAPVGWADLRDELTDRPERLEVWRLDPSKPDPFEPATFEDGLAFALRSTAFTQNPIESNLAEPTMSPEGFDEVRFHPDGLPGGALWPIEQANVIRILAETVIGSGGSLGKIALSPLGDSGDQTARFLDGYASIITETVEGRLTRHRVEIAGRISALWHKAKHVVIYERTTAASAQFVRETGGDSARPILRKVAEYVEILEPVRRYPDDGAATERAAGPLREVRFNATRIAVDSAWGEDIGDIGWRVPLWDRGAARLRPQVYPFPDISFVTAAEGDGEEPLAVQDCLDPDHVYFYTDPVASRDISPDTDAWPPRRGVDYTPLGHPRTLRKVVGIREETEASTPQERPKTRLPPAPRILPGLRAFSWRLARAARLSQINAGRGEKPIFAGLDSVSFMRHPAPPSDKFLKDVRTALERRPGDDVAVFVPGRPYPFVFDAEADAGGMTHYAALVSAIEAENRDGIKQALESIRVNGLRGDIEAALGDIGLASAALDRLPGSKIAKAAATFDKDDCTALAERGADALRRRKLAILRATGEVQADLRRWLANLDLGITEDDVRQALREAAGTAFRLAMADVFATAQAGIGDLRGDIARTRAILADWHREAQASLSNALRRVDEAEASFVAFDIASRTRLDRALADLDNAVDGLEDEALALLDEARRRLAIELSSTARGLGVRITTLIGQVLAAEKAVLSVGRDATEGIEIAKDKALRTIATLPTSKKARDIAAKVPPEAEALKQFLDELAKSDTDTGLDGRKKKAMLAVEAYAAEAVGAVGAATDEAQKHAAAVENELGDLNDFKDRLKYELDAAADDLAENLREEVADLAEEVRVAVDEVRTAANAALSWILGYKEVVNRAAERLRYLIARRSAFLSRVERDAHGAVDTWLLRIETKLDTIETKFPGAIRDVVLADVINPVIDAIVVEIYWDEWSASQAAVRQQILVAVETLTDRIEEGLEALNDLGVEAAKESEELCTSLVGFRDRLVEGVDGYLNTVEGSLKELAGNAAELAELGELIAESERLLGLADTAIDELTEAADQARAFIDRGIEIVSGSVKTDLESLPGRALQLVSFCSTAPEIAALRAGADRLRCIADEAKDVIETPPVRMALAQLGDLAKSLGLDFDTGEFGDILDILPTQQTLNALIPDFAGMDLSGLLGGVGLGGDLTRWVKVSHDLDAKAGRGWIRVDLDIPLPGREKLFSLGPVTLFVTDSHLTAFLRVKATKDSSEVEVTDRAELHTNIEAVVGGQMMVTLQDVRLVYTGRDKLKVFFDPRRIRIHENLRFIQEDLASLFPDTLGGLTILKENGLPVGLEHRLALPPISVNAVTSGIQNITISNRFSLRALPDFVIANRFNISTVDQPFIFSIFIIGGTGYIQIDAEYRPIDDRMLVAVEFGAGGSASLAFSWGPVAGGVFITLTTTIRYAKRIGYSSGDAESGLTVSLVLVIAGHVSLWGMVTIYLGLRLSISYHGSGRVDALGILSIELRISRFFKLKFRTRVTYRLRDGRSETVVTSETETDITDKRAKEALEKLEKLEKTRRSLASAA